MEKNVVFKRSLLSCSTPEEGTLVLEALGRRIPVKKFGSTLLLDRSVLSGPLNPLDLGNHIFKGKKRLSFRSALNRPFISWNLLKVLLFQGLSPQMLKDMLNNYEPFVPYIHKKQESNRPLSKDRLSLNGLQIPFKVTGTSIYLDILGAFTLIGRLKIAMTAEWRDVDRILQEMNLKKDAFKLPKAENTSKKWYGNRSHITIEALLFLLEELVPDEEKRRSLKRLLEHLLGEVDLIRAKWKEIYDELEAGVLAIMDKLSDLESSCKVDRSPKKADVKPGEVIGTESCESTCGRKYHFTLRCCGLNHTLNLADKAVGYIVKDDQVFLDKCSSFSALGRMYVIRCSDYRKSDRILRSSGMDPKQHYLLERRNYAKGGPRNRRTHISLEAFITLVHMGFADSVKNNSLLGSISSIVDDVFALKERCENYFRVSSASEHDDSEVDLPQEESGIESGTSSDAGGSGKCSPLQEEEEESQEEVKTSDKRRRGRKKHGSPQDLLGFSLRTRVEKGNLYLDLHAVFEHLLHPSYRFVPKVKKAVRQFPDLQFPFFPTYFKKSTEKYISGECLLRLIDKQVVQLNDDVPVQELRAQLEELSQRLVVMDQRCSDEKELSNLEDCSEDEGILEGSSVNAAYCAKDDNSSLDIQGLSVPFQVVNDILYLDKKTVFTLLKLSPSGPSYRVYITIDRILEDSNLCLDDAFLYEGRKRSFISSEALKALIRNGLLNSGDEGSLLARLESLEAQKESLRTNRILSLQSFEPLPFKFLGGRRSTVYVHTLQMMKIVGFSPSYVESNPSKAYFTLNRLLAQKGVNVESCFLKQGKSKYVYISLHAVFLLFQTEFGPFKDKEKLKGEILSALQEQGLSEKRGKKRTEEEEDSNSIPLGNELPRLKYKIKDDIIYIHRKSLFEHLGLQKAIMSGSKGYAPINSILANCGVDLERAYIQSRQEKYSYISLEAVLLILDSQEPLMVCLSQRERFFTSLLLTIQGSIGGSILGNEVLLPNDQRIPCKFIRGRLFLLRHTCYSLSGLYDKSHSNSEYDIYEYPGAPLLDRGFTPEDCFFPECGDEYAYISVDALLVLMNLDGDLANRSSSAVKPSWENILTAINVEVPKLKIRVKMEAFRSHLIKFLVGTYLECLRRPIKQQQPMSTNRSVELIDLVTETEDDEEESPDECPPEKKMRVDDVDESTRGRGEEDIFSLDRMHSRVQLASEFDSIKAQILSNSQDGMIGNWEVKRMDGELVRLLVSPSYGSSRKMSFIHPDVAALLSYEFLIQQDMRFAFFINEQKVPSELVEDIVMDRENGILNLLYQLLTLRPCFGSFNPELVETVGKGLVDCSGNDVANIESLCSQIVVDAKFIGSSQNGRTYAGTVRSNNCKVLADSRVSDTCSECAVLDKLVINRSMLTDEAIRPNASSSSSKPEELKTLSSHSDSHQRSVWKIESTDASGCVFVCPQIQSFNTSPPYRFVGSQQATSIVNHRVEISSELELKVALNGKEIEKAFGDFTRNKHVGRLLDEVASLRFCLGYPDVELVEGARYTLANRHLMNADVRKYFECIVVDEAFLAKMGGNGGDLRGTLRIKSCRYISGEFADLCDQCRLLQEPLEFLGI